jgi:tripartite ATP-independent transporter DctM subunit
MSPLLPFEVVAPIMLGSMVGALLLGFPVALTLIGHGFVFLVAGSALGFYPPELMYAQVLRVYGIAYNDTLLAIPFFTLMGMLLERSGIAEDLLNAAGQALGNIRGGLAYAVILVGTVLACTTGVVQASIIAMGLISLPALLAHGYPARLSCGVISASATLAQLIPPSLVLIVMAEVTGVPVVDMYERALAPGLILACAYLAWVCISARWGGTPPLRTRTGYTAAMARRCAVAILPPFALIGCTLGSLLAGVATPTESGAFGALSALALVALRGRMTVHLLRQTVDKTLLISCAAMFIVVGASFFVLPFRGMDGDVWLQAGLSSMPAGQTGFLVAVAVLVFVLAFFLDFFEIAFIVLPLVMPVVRAFGIDPAWFAVLMCVVLQTSFMHPPFGIALYTLRSVAPPHVPTSAIYWGAVPFVAMQLVMAVVLIVWPSLAVPLFTRATELLSPAAVEEILRAAPPPPWEMPLDPPEAVQPMPERKGECQRPCHGEGGSSSP